MINKLLACITLFLSFSTLSFNLLAEESQGVGEVKCSSFNTQKAYREAIEQGKISAIRNWMQKNPDDYNNFIKVEREIYSDLDRYSINPPRSQTYRNKDTGSCRAEVVVDLNVLELRRVFLSSSGNTNKQGLSFVFVAREKDQVGGQSTATTGTRSAVTRDMDRQSTDNSERQTRAEERTNTQITANTYSNEQVTWRTEPVKEVDATVKQEFIRAGYLVAEQSALISASHKQFDPDLIKLGYKENGDIDSSVINSAIEGLRAIPGTPVKLLATAALDVGMPARDANTNLYRVTVTVNGKAFDIDKGSFFTAAVCSTLGVGEGHDTMTAKFNALNKAASDCSKQMVGQMSGNNIR